MSKPSPARYRTTNWYSYNASLRKRGSLLICVDKDMTWLAPHEGRSGRPSVFSNAAIQFCLSIKVLFMRPLRQTVGMVASLLRLSGLDWPVPDFSTLCRRQKTLAVQVPYRRADGSHGRRQWRKVHRAMDPATSDIRAVEFTPSGDGPSHGCAASNHCQAVDSPVLPDLIGQTPKKTSRSAPSPPMAPMTRAAAKTHSTRMTQSRSFRSAETDACERKTARQHASATTPARGAILRQGVLEALDTIPCPQPDQGKDALPDGLWRTHRCTRPGATDRQNPHPHCSHKPLLSPRRRRNRPCGRNSLG
jgi:hypothetical protein